jgi:uridine kinase
MAKPIIQIQIKGDHTSGNTTILYDINRMLKDQGYNSKMPASSYDSENSAHLENDIHIIQIRVIQVQNMKEELRKEVHHG